MTLTDEAVKLAVAAVEAAFTERVKEAWARMVDGAFPGDESTGTTFAEALEAATEARERALAIIQGDGE